MTRRKAVLFGGLAVVFAFGIGFAWQYTRAVRAEAALERTERELDFARMESTLAAAAIAAGRGEHDAAFRQASSFYTMLQQRVDEAPPQAADSLAAILGGRDGTIATISRQDPATADSLERVFMRYRAAIAEPQRAVPLPGAGVQDSV